MRSADMKPNRRATFSTSAASLRGSTLKWSPTRYVTPGGSSTSTCRVERGDALGPALFCSSTLVVIFIGIAPLAPTIAWVTDDATGSIA